MWKYFRSQTKGYIVYTYFEYTPQPSIQRIVRYHTYADQSTTIYQHIPTNSTYDTLDELLYHHAST